MLFFPLVQRYSRHNIAKKNISTPHLRLTFAQLPAAEHSARRARCCHIGEILHKLCAEFYFSLN